MENNDNFLSFNKPELLDLASIIKVSQRISKEITHDGLIKQLIHIVLENASAIKAILILENEENLFIRAQGWLEQEVKIQLESIPLKSAEFMPHSIINYVIRTKKSVVLENAEKDPTFQNDPYIRKNLSKSVLCIPFIKQRELFGILYLENDLIPGVFTSERLEFLKVLASQAIISLENANLFESLIEAKMDIEQKNEELQQAFEELETTNEELEATNEELIESQQELVENEKKLKASLHEKEILLQEIHHRVKNNLQIISSLLSLQSKYISDQRDMEIFMDCKNRIHSMALVHERLYQSKNFALIDFQDYIQKLINYISNLYSKVSQNIQLSINVIDVFLSIDYAIPCALIIYEMISNSFKHAFDEKTKGEIKIQFYKEKEEYTLIVMDTGKGIPPNLDHTTSETFGLKLIQALTEQLRGDIKLDRRAGTKFTLIFPANFAKNG
jgi:two-component sensor histidine kinase